MAAFVERAVLMAVDQASAPIKKINRELNQLFATANKLRSMKLNLAVNAKGLTAAQSQIKRLQADMAKLAQGKSAAASLGNVQTSGISRYLAIVKQIETSAKATQQALNNARAPRQSSGGGGGGGGGQATGRGVAAGLAAAFNPYRAGRSMGFGFLASIGGRALGSALNIGQTAGAGIVTRDDAVANAVAQGINVAALEGAASRSAENFKGTNVGDIMAGATEQVANLQSQLATNKITQEQYNTALQATTDRLARNSQIFTAMGQDQARAAENARQQEKTLANNLPVGTSQKSKNAFNEALLQAQIGVGGDVQAEEVKRAGQQLGSGILAKLSPEGLKNVVLARDEGGARSTAEIRQFMNGLTRINKTRTALAAQREAGFRKADDTTAFSNSQLSDPVATILDRLVPPLEKLGVNLDDATAVNAALQKKFGLTQTEANFPTAQIVNRDQLRLERERIARVSPETLRRQQTLRVEMADVKAKFQDAAASATKGALPVVKNTLDGISDVLQRASEGKSTVSDAAKTGAAVLGLGAAAALPASLKGFEALSSSDMTTSVLGAIAVNTANTATGVAALNATGALGGGLGGKLLKGFGLAALVTGSFALLRKSFENDLSREGPTPAKLVRDIIVQGNANVVARNNLANQRINEDRTTRANTPEARAELATIVARAVANQRLGTEDRLTRARNTPETQRQITSITADNILVKNLAGIERSDRELAAARSLNATPALEDRATRERGANEFDKMLAGMDTAASTIQAAFGTGGQQAGDAIAQGGAQAGTSVHDGVTMGGTSAAAAMAAAITGAGASAGASIAAAMASAVANVSVNVRQPATANVGSSHPGKD